MDRRMFLSISAALAATQRKTMAAVAPASEASHIEWLRFDHVSIHVANFDGMVRWYQEKLGFKLEVSWRVEALNGKQLACPRMALGSRSSAPFPSNLSFRP